MICKTMREGEGAKSSFHEDLGLNVEKESRENTQIKRTVEWREGVGGGGAREEQRVDKVYEYTQRAID